ncbi:hypothetical protein D3C83_147110 [compost metagenome]
MGVAHDAVQPIGERQGFVVSMEEPKGPKEGLLNQVLGFRGISRQSYGKAVGLAVGLFQQNFESFLPLLNRCNSFAK